MEDLNLRREFWEAMGWRECQEIHSNIVPHHRCGCLQDPAGNTYANASLPPVEIDEGLALRELVKFCEDQKLWARLHINISNSDRYFCELSKKASEKPVFPRGPLSAVYDTTPARAICLAVIAVVKGATKA